MSTAEPQIIGGVPAMTDEELAERLRNHRDTPEMVRLKQQMAMLTAPAPETDPSGEISLVPAETVELRTRDLTWADRAPTLRTYIFNLASRPSEAYLTIITATRELLPSLSVTDTPLVEIVPSLERFYFSRQARCSRAMATEPSSLSLREIGLHTRLTLSPCETPYLSVRFMCLHARHPTSLREIRPSLREMSFRARGPFIFVGNPLQGGSCAYMELLLGLSTAGYSRRCGSCG